jgi:methylase of polypeptide subunit release factors
MPARAVAAQQAAPRLDRTDVLDALRSRLAEAGYTDERLEETLGGGGISFSEADLAMHERRLPPGEPFSALVRLFLLGEPLAANEAEAALGSVDVEGLLAAGWLEPAEGGARAALKVVPHGDVLIASDREAGGSVGSDWVPGIHPPSVTLAKLTVRRRAERALDVATGNGVHALLASRHADTVVATDVNPRALAVAALNARLNRADNVELRQGSYFAPVEGERFDLLTCNPPYVISPEARYAYRDSGLSGDTVSRRVVQQAPKLLEEGGFAHILVSWAHTADDPWEPLERWVEGCGCDSLLLWFGSDDPLTHASEWLRPVAREDPGGFRARLDEWLDYLAGLGIESIAHGAVVLRRRSDARNWTRTNCVSVDRLEQAGDHVLRLFAAQDYLESLGDDRGLLDSPFALVDGHRLEQTFVCRDGRADLRSSVLSLDGGLAFRIGLDEQAARLLPLLDGRPVGAAVDQRSIELELGPAEARRLEDDTLPVVRRLVELGFLRRAA